MLAERDRAVGAALALLPHHAGDWWAQPAYYPALAALARRAAPRGVLEVGALVGYSLVTFLHAVPDLAALWWIDDERDLPGSNARASANVRFYLAGHGRMTGELDLRAITAPALTALPRLGPAAAGRIDLVYLDAEHTASAVLAQLEAVEQSIAPRVYLVDDALHEDGVRPAVRQFCRVRRLPWALARTWRGLAIIDRRCATAAGIAARYGDAGVAIWPGADGG